MALTTPEGRIFQAFMKRILAFNSGGWPVVPPNVSYPADAASKAPNYLVVTHSPNRPRRETINPAEDHTLRGIFQVALLTELGKSADAATEMAGKIAVHFSPVVQLVEGTTRVRITQRPQVVGGYRDNDRWRTPVNIEYETIAL